MQLLINVSLQLTNCYTNETNKPNTHCCIGTVFRD